jgi:2-keto-4-pentenoate hydratase
MTDPITDAAELLAKAYRGGTRPAALPEAIAPATPDAAHAVQVKLADMLGQQIVGWKIGKRDGDTVLRGGLLGDRVLASPARIPASQMPLLGVEPEIAYRVTRALAPRPGGYAKADLLETLEAFVAIEVVDTRFDSYQDAPFLHRLADFMSNGALICGSGAGDWAKRDFEQVEVVLTVNGTEVSRAKGGHASGDPILPALELINHLTQTDTIAAGTVLTTGTFAGLRFVTPGDHIDVEFVDFGRASVSFPA